MMNDVPPLEQIDYTPNRLCDTLSQLLGVQSDADLAQRLGVSKVIIARIRNVESVLSPTLLIRMHEASGMSILDLRRLAGDTRLHYKPIQVQRRKHANGGGLKKCSHGFLDALCQKLGLRSDQQLAIILGVRPPTISKVRNGKHAVSSRLLLRIHQSTGLPLAELRALIDGETVPPQPAASVAKSRLHEAPATREHRIHRRHPHVLLDSLRLRFDLKSDLELASACGLAPSVLSKLRHGKLALSSNILLRLHDATGISIAELQKLGADDQVIVDALGHKKATVNVVHVASGWRTA